MRCACGSSGAAGCGAGGVMAWERGRNGGAGKGREGAEGVDVDYALLLDESGEVTGRVYGVFGPPTVYFVDRRGNLVGRVVGPRGWDSPAGRKFIDELLDAK